MVQDIMPGTEEQLQKEMTSAYIGFDPTADSLHIGSLVPILLLVHLQKAGHKPYALVGGATGMVGDPSGKKSERNLLDEETLRHNQRSAPVLIEACKGGNSRIQIERPLVVYEKPGVYTKDILELYQMV